VHERLLLAGGVGVGVGFTTHWQILFAPQTSLNLVLSQLAILLVQSESFAHESVGAGAGGVGVGAGAGAGAGADFAKH